MEQRNNRVLAAIHDPATSTAINSSFSGNSLEIVNKAELEDILTAFNTEKFSAIIIEDCFLKRNEVQAAIKAHIATNDQIPTIFGISPANEQIEVEIDNNCRILQTFTNCIDNNFAPLLENASELYNLRIENNHIKKERNEAQQKLIFLQTNNESLISDKIDEIEAGKIELAQQCMQKSAYIASKSHCLRNILHGILSFATIGEMKCDSAAPEKMKEFFRYISDSGHKLEHILEELVYLSKLECDRIDQEIDGHNIYKAIKQSVDNQNDLINEKNVKIEIEMLLENQRIEFDKEMIIRLFDNLISNAALYSDPDKLIKIQFEESTTSDNQPALKILVKDNGNGFQVPLDKVFERYNIPETRDKMAPDAGLGLSICHEIVTKHNGSIEIADTGAEGSTLAVTLPYKQPKITSEDKPENSAFAAAFGDELTDFSDQIEAVLNSETPKPQSHASIIDNREMTSDSNDESSEKEKEKAQPAEDLGSNVDLF